MSFLLGVVFAWGVGLMSDKKCRCPSDTSKQLDRLMLERDILSGKRTIEQVEKEMLEFMERNTQSRTGRPATRNEKVCTYSLAIIISLICIFASVFSVVCFAFRYRPEPCVGCGAHDLVCEFQRFFMGEPACHDQPERPQYTWGEIHCDGPNNCAVMGTDGTTKCVPCWSEESGLHFTDCAKEKC